MPKMPVSSGRIIKTRKGKNVVQQKHRWESFSAKISKLHSLDSLKKVRRHDLENEDTSSSASYFRKALDKHADQNIAMGFTSFRREVAPLSDSLPQILLHQDSIMELMEKYISTQEKDSMEPLLELLTAFAHDLGVRFENFFPRALGLIIAIASRPQSAEVIEWTFSCLAFLFKYLSKLLVPDLRPTYSTVSPLLGKVKQPPYIARVAAEAMSYLVRKAASPANRKAALRLIVSHIRDDMYKSLDSQQYQLYYHGIMTMFAEAFKIPGTNLHSTAPEILLALLFHIPNTELHPDFPTPWVDVICGVITSAIHHSDSATFAPLEYSILGYIQGALDSDSLIESPWKIALFCRILGVISSVQRGTRVGNWQSLVNLFISILEQILSCQNEDHILFLHDAVWDNIIVSACMIWRQSPVDALIPVVTKFSSIMTREPLLTWFIPFSSLLSELEPQRFKSLFQKDFQRFISLQWSNKNIEALLCVVLPRMVESGALPSKSSKDVFHLPQSWQIQVEERLDSLKISPFPEQAICSKDPGAWCGNSLLRFSGLLKVFDSFVWPTTGAKVADILHKKLKLSVQPSTLPTTDEARFIVTHGFQTYLNLSQATGSVDPSLSPLLKAAAPKFVRLPVFLNAMTRYEKFIENSGKGGMPCSDLSDTEDTLFNCLIENLTSASSTLRLETLHLLQQLNKESDPFKMLSTMREVEETPFDFQNIRLISSILLQRIGQNFSKLTANSWLVRAVPAFLFGMLTVNIMPVTSKAVECLKLIGECKLGEQTVCDLAFEWITVPSPRLSRALTNVPAKSQDGLTDFECTNLIQIQSISASMKKTLEQFSDSLTKPNQAQEAEQFKIRNARFQALQVLLAQPSLAEKWSRKLVPHLLSWADDATVVEIETVDDSDQRDTDYWSYADRKALLSVFAQFSNPRVIYQSEDVYQALLNLMGNGDVEIQKLALKAILAWKQEEIRPYQQNLEHLLDDVRFRNELTVFFHGDQNILHEHRQVLMPVLLRLLYGRSVAKKGTNTSLQGTRKAVLRSLTTEDMSGYLDIILGKLRGIIVVGPNGVRDVSKDNFIEPRRQVGFLNMAQDLITEMGPGILPFASRVLQAILYCLFWSCRKTYQCHGSRSKGVEAVVTAYIQTSRKTALRCLVSLYENTPTFDWNPFMQPIVSEVITPRVNMLPDENLQSVSSMFQLLLAWAVHPQGALGLGIDKNLMCKLAEILSLEKAKDEVKIHVLQIFRGLIQHSAPDAEVSEFSKLIREEIINPHVQNILTRVNGVLLDHPSIGTSLLEACIHFTLETAAVVQESECIQSLVGLCVKILAQPPSSVNPRIKSTTLLVIERFILKAHLDDRPDLRHEIFVVISSLFSYFKDSTNRETLARILSNFSTFEPSMKEPASLCIALNSYLEGQIDMPDYARRLSAFVEISCRRQTPFTADQWLPLLHNLIFFIKSDEEAGVLSMNSSDGLCRLIRDAASASDPFNIAGFNSMLSKTLLSDIYNGVKETAEGVQTSYLRVIHHLAKFVNSITEFSDLKVFLSDDDIANENSDAILGPSIFNIHVLDKSTQIAVLSKITKINLKLPLSSNNVGKLLIPLLEHFILDTADGVDDGGVSAAATATISELAHFLEWHLYRAILRKYIGFIQTRPEISKRILRLVGKFADALVLAAAEKQADETKDGLNSHKCHLAITMPAQEKLTEESLLLTPLFTHLHKKDESTVSARVPVGITVVKLLQLLSDTLRDQRLPSVLLDICHILRSKSWESREKARDTLAQIAQILGPSGFGYILNELKSTLTKGYQLHVLSYTLHSILLGVVSNFGQGHLDCYLSSIMKVVMDDVFGVTGEEKEAEDYHSKYKEVKSRKSQDTMELMARNSSISHLINLVRPLQLLLMEKLNYRIVCKVDELLSRITAGLLKNPAAESQETLIFCYEVAQEVYHSREPKTEKEINPRLKGYLVQRGAKNANKVSTSNYAFKLIRFVLDTLCAMFRKHDSLRNRSNIQGFLPLIGDAVIEGQEEVKISAFKLLAIIAKVPFKESAERGLYQVAIKEAAKSISTSPSMSASLAQAALKLISTVLRDRNDILVKDTIVDTILKKLKDDLLEPENRDYSFSFLRCLLDRKVHTALVYDTLDHIGYIMVTNDDKKTRDLARGAFVQFIREYPQKKTRWEKQLNFVVANLKYEREGGRISVMEVIHYLLMKSSDDFVQEVIGTCFVPLVFVVANDESEQCRLAAGELTKEIFRLADAEHKTNFIGLMRSWMTQRHNSAVFSLGLKTMGFYFEASDSSPKQQNDVGLALKSARRSLYSENDKINEELACNGLHVIAVLAAKHPAQTFGVESLELWTEVFAGLSSTSEAIRLASAKLVSIYLANFARANKLTNTTSHLPMRGSNGLVLDHTTVSILVRHVCEILLVDRVGEALASEASRILLFLSKFLDFEETEDSIDLGEESESEDGNNEDGRSRLEGSFVLSQLSKVLRRDMLPTTAHVIPKLVALNVLHTLCKARSAKELTGSLKILLLSINHMTDPDVPMMFSSEQSFTSQYNALKDKAAAVAKLLQDKVGTAEYTKHLIAVKEIVREKRKARAIKRKMLDITDPEKYGRQKRRKYMKEKVRRKGKIVKFRAIRHSC